MSPTVIITILDLRENAEKDVFEFVRGLHFKFMYNTHNSECNKNFEVRIFLYFKILKI